MRNSVGNTVRTEWRSSVQLRAIKRAHQASTLEEINITETRPKGDNSLTLTTSINTDSDHEVSYELLVPAHVTLKLETRDGPIEVSDVNGSVIARTTRAPITIKNVTDTVIANTKESGSITIEHVTSFRATTDNGSITATQIAKDAVASATTGNVSVSLAKLSERGAIALHTGDGTVELKWLTPQGSTGRRKAINALLTGKKENCLTSDHCIALTARTLKAEPGKEPFCIGATRKICRCGLESESLVQQNTNRIKKKMRSTLAQAAKYFYPSRWFMSRRDG